MEKLNSILARPLLTFCFIMIVRKRLNRRFRCLMLLFLLTIIHCFGSVEQIAYSKSINNNLLITHNNDSNDGACTTSDCSLREAIIAANANPGSTINIPAGTYTLSLGSSGEDFSAGGDLDIRTSVTIIGEGQVIIDAGGMDRVFDVLNGNLQLSNLTIQSGQAMGGGMRVAGPATVSLSDVTYTSNQSSSYGGAIFNEGDLHLSACTLVGNYAAWDGGAIYNLGDLALDNVTISGNRANRNGGGMAMAGGTAELASVTITENTADANVSGSGDGGGISQSGGSLEMRNTILADNQDRTLEAPDCAGQITCGDYNLIGSYSGCTILGATSHSLFGVDPMLNPLADNGGSTETHALAITSPAIDAGNPFGCVGTDASLLNSDQRGEARTQDGDNDGTPVCDIGAYELAGLPATTISDLTVSLIDTNQWFTSGLDAAIGEVLTYEIQFTLPPGAVPDGLLVVRLDQGLVFSNCSEMSASSDLVTVAMDGGLAGVCAAPTVSSGGIAVVDQGRVVAFDFTGISNHGTQSAVVSLTMHALVLDSQGNQSDQEIGASVEWQDSGGIQSADSEAALIQEPDLDLRLSAVPMNGYGADPIVFTLQLNHTGASQTNAFNVLLEADLTGEIVLVENSLTYVSGYPPLSMNEVGDSITVQWNNYPDVGQPTVLTFEGHLTGLQMGDFADVSAALTWTSLPGFNQIPMSAYNPFSTERFYSPGSTVDDYIVEDQWRISKPELPASGFAPGVSTQLPFAHESFAFVNMGGLTMSVPELDVTAVVVGVPVRQDQWDVQWLGSSIGYLSGTAYPTWEGNSGFTAHAYLPDGSPGPFVDLDQLRWGDQVIISAFGEDHVYEVRSVTYVLPNDAGALAHKDGDWITLISCKGYDPVSDAFRYRVVVSAVLMDVK